MGDRGWGDHPALASGMVAPEALDLQITEARVHELRFPMDPPLRLAGRSVPTREYVVLEVDLENGRTGTGYVLTRGRPIAAAAEALADQLVGVPLGALFATEPTGRGRSEAQRAHAIADLCAWDLVGQAREVPTWRLFGEARATQPVLLVAGYRRHDESDRAMAERLATWYERGYRWLKIAAEPYAARTTGVLAELRRIVPSADLRIVVDMGFAGGRTEQLISAAKEWESHGLTWIEDPVPVVEAHHIAAMRAGSRERIAAGDEASPDELDGLLELAAVDVLRADATTTGGLTGLRHVIARTDVPISLHIYPEIHRHIAFTLGGTSPVETFPPDDPFDFVDRFIRTDDWTMAHGDVEPPTAVGLGLRYCPDEVPEHVVRSTRHQAPANEEIHHG